MKTFKILFLLPVLALMVACTDSTKVKFDYDHPERYSVGNATIEQPVKTISVDWFCGDVDIRYSDSTEFRIYEETAELQSPLADSMRMHYYVDEDGELNVQFCGNGKFRYGDLKNLNKHLYVEVPRGMAIEEVDIDGVDTRMYIWQVLSREVSIDGVKVNVNAYYSDALPDEIDLDGVNCLLALNVNPKAGLTIEMSGVTPQLRCDMPSVKKGDKTIVGDGQCKVDADGVNVKLIIHEME